MSHWLRRSPATLASCGFSTRCRTLLFDRCSYDYAGHRLAGLDPQAPVLRCEPRGPVPVPAQLPRITWRAGLDLSPLDVTRDDDVRWLSCLVWPGEGDRQERLAAAVASARRDPPAVHRGDLLADLPALAAQAPADATLVVYHSAGSGPSGCPTRDPASCRACRCPRARARRSCWPATAGLPWPSPTGTGNGWSGFPP
jgi:hypothetical protein